MHAYARGCIEKPLGGSRSKGETTTNLTHKWRRHRDLDPGHIGGRGVISPLRRKRRLHKSRAENIQNRKLS